MIYPELPESPRPRAGQEAAAARLRRGVLVRDQGRAPGRQGFIESLRVFSHLANVGDAKSLVIHPATTTHYRMSDDDLKKAGITAGTVRLSIGLEDAQDLIDDLDRALKVFRKMNFEVAGKRAFAYTAAHELDPAKPTVVFVHGAGLDHSWFGLQSRYFGYHGRNVLALDLPGHGRSEGPPLPTIEEMADWVSAVLKRPNTPKASIVGHSMGSLVALEFAARHPEQAERIAFCAIAFPMKVSEAFLEAARANDYSAFDMEHDLGPRGAGAARRQPESRHVDVRRYARAPRAPRAGRAARRPQGLQRLCGRPRKRREGEMPGAFHPRPARRDDAAARDHRRYSEKFTNARTVEIPVSGHSLMAEAPDACSTP